MKVVEGNVPLNIALYDTKINRIFYVYSSTEKKNPPIET